MKVEQIAEICHEANRTYCKIIGDPVQPCWDESPQWQRESAINGVIQILNGYLITPGKTHESWMAHKIADGWKYGPVKDAEKKEHPCLVPYDQLPEEQRRKDYLFLSIVTAFQHQIK